MSSHRLVVNHRDETPSGEDVLVGVPTFAAKADQIGSYRETAFPIIKRSVGDLFSLSRSKNYVLGLLEVDVTEARELIRLNEAETREALSFTAWIARCLAQAISEFPAANSYRKGSRRIVEFEDVDVLVVVEKHVGASRYPLPYVIRKANEKTVQTIHNEIRLAQTGHFRDEGTAIREEASRDPKSILLRVANPWRLPTFVRRLYWKGFRTNPFKVKRVMGTTGITAVGMFTRNGGWAVAPGAHTIDLGIGGIARRPRVIGDHIGIGEFLDLSIQVDHEMVDGAPAARFATRLCQLMESAFELETIRESERMDGRF